jgi:predicted exporter
LSDVHDAAADATQGVASALAPRGARHWASVLWLAAVLGVLVHQLAFWRDARLETDVLALLPRDERAPDVERATRQLADQAARRVVAMVGARDWTAARAAAAAWRGALATHGAGLVPVDVPAGGEADRSVAFYAPWRDRLLTPEQRAWLRDAAPAALERSALASLHQPGAGPRLTEWAADPLALWPQWWAERAGEIRARPRDGELALSDDGLEWIVLPYTTPGGAFTFDGERRLETAFRAAEAAAREQSPGVRVLVAGVPLHVESAAALAYREVNAIGWGSLAAVLLLVWLAFRATTPIVLIGLSLVVGMATALSVTAWAFGSVHLMTLVFGASLVGVAEDYGIHYFASRQGRPGLAPRRLMRRLLPGLLVALGTSVLGYLVLGLAPFPGLRQMALFSAVGLAAAFVTVWCWFPLLDRRGIGPNGFASTIADSLASWPRLRWTTRHAAAGAALALAAAAGLAQLRADDDIRQLQATPAALAYAQREVGRLLGVASPVQFFIVRGSSEAQVLEHEEALKDRLQPLVRDGAIGGWRALSDWVPSPQRQQADAELTARVEAQVVAGVNRTLGEALARPAYEAQPLGLAQWLASPASAAGGALWLGDTGGTHASVVMLRGLGDPAALPRLAAAADGVPGVRWVDRTAEVSSLLGRYRYAMGGLLLAAHAGVLLVLALRYRRAAWRAWLPTALASLGVLAMLGWLGLPLQLFHVLALALLLGVGIDYGVFLLEHRGDGSAWLAVILGAASTGLAFGLLALSHTPALHAFGLTLAIGLALVAVLAPGFRAPPDSLPRRIHP